MKVVLLAGGLGTRIGEETHLKPKPMVEIGGMPILLHIMKIYSYYGFNDFIICCGYKAYIIKEYFHNYFMHCSDMTIDFREGNKITFHTGDSNPFRVTVVNTGLHTMTGGRIKRIQPFIPENDSFMVTYGDGVSDINMQTLLDYHKSHGKIATLTGVQLSGRFGSLALDESNMVKAFREKPENDGSWINAGFFVFKYDIFHYLSGDETVLERKPLESLADEEQLAMYAHKGFWSPMDMLKDKQYLEGLWLSGRAPWKKG